MYCRKNFNIYVRWIIFVNIFSVVGGMSLTQLLIITEFRIVYLYPSIFALVIFKCWFVFAVTISNQILEHERIDTLAELYDILVKSIDHIKTKYAQKARRKRSALFDGCGLNHPQITSIIYIHINLIIEMLVSIHSARKAIK